MYGAMKLGAPKPLQPVVKTVASPGMKHRSFNIAPIVTPLSQAVRLRRSQLSARDIKGYDIHTSRSVLSRWRHLPLKGLWKLSARARS